MHVGKTRVDPWNHPDKRGFADKKAIRIEFIALKREEKQVSEKTRSHAGFEDVDLDLVQDCGVLATQTNAIFLGDLDLEGTFPLILQINQVRMDGALACANEARKCSDGDPPFLVRQYIQESDSALIGLIQQKQHGSHLKFNTISFILAVIVKQI